MHNYVAGTNNIITILYNGELPEGNEMLAKLTRDYNESLFSLLQFDDI